MLIPKVTNMNSPRSGKPVANQFTIEIGTLTFFQSYSTVIAVRDPQGHITLDKDMWDYSITTSKYRNEFLNENTATTRKNIANGTHSVADLN